MSEFINIEDYDASLHREILDALVRSDASIVEVCEDQAIAEMKGYIGLKYDAEKIFARRGSERNSLILMYAKDITIYHIFCLHNPMKMSDMRKDRYDNAMAWLKGVSKGQIIIDGADELTDEDAEKKAEWQLYCNPLNPTHF